MVTPSGNRELFQWKVHPKGCSLFTMGSELRAAGESPYTSQATTSPGMLSSHSLACLYPMTVSLQPLFPKDLYGSARSQWASLGASSLTVLATRLDSLRTVVMPHLPPDTGSVPSHLDPSPKAMSRSSGTAFQEPPQPRAREEMTW